MQTTDCESHSLALTLRVEKQMKRHRQEQAQAQNATDKISPAFCVTSRLDIGISCSPEAAGW